jgi:hypothetical protein
MSGTLRFTAIRVSWVPRLVIFDQQQDGGTITLSGIKHAMLVTDLFVYPSTNDGEA